jgi:hypothetical protein
MRQTRASVLDCRHSCAVASPALLQLEAAVQPVLSNVMIAGSCQSALKFNIPHRCAAGSLGYGDLIVLEDDAADHPLDAPEGADATRILAGETASTGGRAAAGFAAGGAAGRGRRGLRKRQEVVGVHGGDEHAPEDEQTRNVQVGAAVMSEQCGRMG